MRQKGFTELICTFSLFGSCLSHNFHSTFVVSQTGQPLPTHCISHSSCWLPHSLNSRGQFWAPSPACPTADGDDSLESSRLIYLSSTINLSIILSHIQSPNSWGSYYPLMTPMNFQLQHFSCSCMINRYFWKCLHPGNAPPCPPPPLKIVFKFHNMFQFQSHET